MRVKDYCSAGLRTGSTFLKVIGVLCILGAIFAWFLDGPGWELMGAGVATLLMGVLFKGLYPLSSGKRRNKKPAAEKRPVSTCGLLL